MNVKNLRAVPLLLSALFLLSCATSFDVATDFDENFDFSSFTSFAVVTPDGIDTMVDDLAQERVESALVEQLVARGYRNVPAAEADFLVSYFGTSEEGTDIRTYQSYNSHYGYARCYRCGGAIVPVRSTRPTTQVRTVEYVRGLLMVDMIKPDTQTLKWRGQTAARFSSSEARNMTPEQRRELAYDAVASILEEFPPQY